MLLDRLIYTRGHLWIRVGSGICRDPALRSWSCRKGSKGVDEIGTLLTPSIGPRIQFFTLYNNCLIFVLILGCFPFKCEHDQRAWTRHLFISPSFNYISTMSNPGLVSREIISGVIEAGRLRLAFDHSSSSWLAKKIWGKSLLIVCMSPKWLDFARGTWLEPPGARPHPTRTRWERRFSPDSSSGECQYIQTYRRVILPSSILWCKCFRSSGVRPAMLNDLWWKRCSV